MDRETINAYNKRISDVWSDYDKIPKDKRPDFITTARQTEYNILMEYKALLAKECGIDTHPKLDILWDIAWDMGHANGISEVSSYFERFSRLLIT